MSHQQEFSEKVESWLRSDSPKTFGRLTKVFGKSSFATIFIICMAFPALPIPTGGITHVLEVLVMLVALQTIIGLQTIWLPKWLARREVPNALIKKALPSFVKYLKKLESHSRIRGSKILNSRWCERVAGIAVFSFALSAFFAIPFSGLDTVVALGAVLLSLGLVLTDIVYFLVGLLIGLIGIVIQVTLGAVVARGIQRLWSEVGTEARLIGLAAIVLIIAALIIRHRKH